MIRIGIVGLGHMGTYHAKLCSTRQDALLVGVADTNPQNFEKITDTTVRCELHYEELLDVVDALIIATPTPSHFSIARDALDMGVHVLIEKPITSTHAEAQDLFARADAANLVLHVGHVERFNSVTSLLAERIDKPFLIECRRTGPFTPRARHESVILDLMIHDLDLVLGLTGHDATSYRSLTRQLLSDNDDIALAYLTLEDGTLCTFLASRASTLRERSMRVHQEHTVLDIDFMKQTIIEHTAGADQPVRHELAPVNALAEEIDFFIAAIKGEAPRTSSEHDLRVIALANKLHAPHTI